MTARLADVEARIGTLRQLDQVVGAIRAIAAARSRAALVRRAAVRAHAAIVARAIGRVTALSAGREPPAGPVAATSGRAVVAFCAEQGFAGAFSASVLERAAALVDPGRRVTWLVVGDRGLLAARERGLEPDWTAPMIQHDDQATQLARRLVEALWRFLGERAISRVDMVHRLPGAGGEAEIVVHRLLPFDFARFPPETGAPPPLVTLEPEVLAARLVEEYVFAELCEAVILSFVAEGEARVRAMTAAKEKIGETLVETRAHARRLRQEAITDEIVELASGALEEAEPIVLPAAARSGTG